MLAPLPEPWLTVKEAAEVLRVAPKTLYRWLETKCHGEVPHHRIGSRTLRFRRSELEAWISKL